MMPDLFLDLARGMERACFDYLIIEDSSNLPYTYQGSHDTYLRYGASTPKLDPAVLVPYLAQATKHLGLVPTLSVTEYPPFLAGAAGELAGSRHGRPRRLELRHRQQRRRVPRTTDATTSIRHDERYDVADEFAELVTKLWRRGA